MHCLGLQCGGQIDRKRMDALALLSDEDDDDVEDEEDLEDMEGNSEAWALWKWPYGGFLKWGYP